MSFQRACWYACSSLALVALLSLAACGSSSSTAAATSTATTPATATVAPSPTATATTAPPTATPTPAPGVCNPADFPTKTPGGPNHGFQYPPLTYYYYQGSGAGNNYNVLCSSGTPDTILAFLKQSIPAGGWTIKSSTATTINATQTSAPQGGFCPSVDITVGSHVGYPGEWNADFHPPAGSC
jgi:hypothetical protein